MMPRRTLGRTTGTLGAPAASPRRFVWRFSPEARGEVRLALRPASSRRRSVGYPKTTCSCRTARCPVSTRRRGGSGSTPRWRRRAGTSGSGASRTWGRRTGRSSTPRRSGPGVGSPCGTATGFGWGNALTPPPCTWAWHRLPTARSAAAKPPSRFEARRDRLRASRRGWKIASSSSARFAATRRLRSSRCSTATAATRRRFAPSSPCPRPWRGFWGVGPPARGGASGYYRRRLRSATRRCRASTRVAPRR
mmetsp:Transcript_10108/g.40873  ORF Transcript_10108/g.40873 Transcript_10108/m.40873 type:complete len:250 (-) Transcript_10108:653-1402(-)